MNKLTYILTVFATVIVTTIVVGNISSAQMLERFNKDSVYSNCHYSSEQSMMGGNFFNQRNHGYMRGSGICAMPGGMMQMSRGMMQNMMQGDMMQRGNMGINMGSRNGSSIIQGGRIRATRSMMGW